MSPCLSLTQNGIVQQKRNNNNLIIIKLVAYCGDCFVFPLVLQIHSLITACKKHHSPALHVICWTHHFPFSLSLRWRPQRPLTIAPPQAVSRPLLCVCATVFVVVVTRRLLLRQLLAVLQISLWYRRRRGRELVQAALHPGPWMVPSVLTLILLSAQRSFLIPLFVRCFSLSSWFCVVSGTRRVRGAAAAQGTEHGAGAGVQGERGGVWFSDPGAWGPVGFLDESHKHHPLVSSILDLLLGEWTEGRLSQNNNNKWHKYRWCDCCHLVWL